MARQPMFVMGSVVYLYRNGRFVGDYSNGILTDQISGHLYEAFRKAPTHRRIYEMFLKAGCLQKNFDELNQCPVEWIPFSNGMYDPVTETIIPHDSKFLAINQLPVSYDPTAAHSGAVIEQWLGSIAPEADDREMFLEFCGLCMNRDTRQQKFLILCGEGGSGKSTPLSLLSSIIGEDNVANVALEQLSQRFAVFNLMGKLTDVCADLKIQALEDVTIVKKLTGEDRLFAEQKGKDGFSFRSYAKLIFSTNELPLIRDERSNGFYRRLLVLNFPKPPEHPDPNLLEKLRKEADYFIHLSMKALHRMYENGHITESSGSAQAVKRLRLDSDTVEAFLSEKAFIVPDGREERGRLYAAYLLYCQSEERRELNRNTFFRALRTKGFEEIKSHGDRFFRGISLTKTAPKCPQIAEKCPHNGPEDDDEPLPWE